MIFTVKTMQTGATISTTIFPFFRLCSIQHSQHLFYVRVRSIQQSRPFTTVLRSNCFINVGNHRKNVVSPKSGALTATGLSSGNNFKLFPRKFSSSGDSNGEKKLKSTLSKSFPKATNIIVEDISGGCGSMYQIFIESKEFAGLSTVKQHLLVNTALKNEIKEMHGLRIQTAIPKG